MKTIYEQGMTCIHLRQVVSDDNRFLYEAGLSHNSLEPDLIVVTDDPLTIGKRYVVSVSEPEREELS